MLGAARISGWHWGMGNWQERIQGGFVLPIAMLYLAGVAAVAAGWLGLLEARLELAQMRAVRERLDSLIELQIDPLLGQLGRHILPPGGSTVWRAADELEKPEHRVVLPVVLDGAGGVVALSSAGEIDGEPLEFPTYDGRELLSSAYVPTFAEQTGRTFALGWAYEDLALSDPQVAPPRFYPFPDWQYYPLEEHSDESWQWDTADVLPGPLQLGETAAIPFRPDLSELAQPVLLAARLHIGVFAAGPASNPAKTVRLRYYLECQLWNPWNRPLRMHSGTARRSVTEAIFWNLPSLRLRNESTGMASAWLSLDDARNSSTGKAGISAWLRIKGVLGPGEVYNVLEPDPRYQPEGLTRTLLTGFAVEPQDRIRIEFEPSPAGVGFALLPLGESDPLASARAGNGWLRRTGQQAHWPDLYFEQAEQPNWPFLLTEGSLGFRPRHVQTKLQIGWQELLPELAIEPRLRKIDSEDHLFHARDGRVRADRHWLTQVVAMGSQPWPEPAQWDPVGPLAPFSWPSGEAASVWRQLDLPLPMPLFRLGSANAPQINTLLHEPQLRQRIAAKAMASVQTWPTVAGGVNRWVPALHIQQGKPMRWLEAFLGGAVPQQPWPGKAFALYADPRDSQSEDFQYLPAAQITRLAEEQAANRMSHGLTSLAALFDQGELLNALPEVQQQPPGQWLALRGLLRDAPLLVAHGATGILHIAAKSPQPGPVIRRYARLWVRIGSDANGNRCFLPFHLERMDPALLR